MKSFKILFSASLLALGANAALAEETWNPPAPGFPGFDGTIVLNSQINLQNNWSNLNVGVAKVGGDVVGQGAAAGNLLDVITMNNTYVNSSQIVGPGAAIGSNINMDVNKVWGSVGIQNEAVCNGVSVSTDPLQTAIYAHQQCQAADPFSGINANIRNVAGDAVIQGSAMGNLFESDSNAVNMPITTRQINNAVNTSNINSNVYNVGGSVGFSSSAIGNSSRVIQYKAQ